MHDDTVELIVSMRYRHRFGALVPWARGLRRGVAMATRCAACDRIWFAPRLVCSCGHGDMKWMSLSGRGTVRFVVTAMVTLPLTSRQQAWPIALIAMDGTCNAVLGRLTQAAGATPGLRVRLVRDPGAGVHPVQQMLFVPDDAED